MSGLKLPSALLEDSLLSHFFSYQPAGRKIRTNLASHVQGLQLTGKALNLHTSIRPPIFMTAIKSKGNFSWTAFPQALHVDYFQDMFTSSVRWWNLLGMTSLSAWTCKGRDLREWFFIFSFLLLGKWGLPLDWRAGKISPFSSVLMLWLRHQRDLGETRWRQQEPPIPALCFRKLHTPRSLSPCPSCTAVPTPAMGSATLSWDLPLVCATCSGRGWDGKTWLICSCYCSFSNTAEALQLLPAACLSLCSLITVLTGILKLSK